MSTNGTVSTMVTMLVTEEPAVEMVRVATHETDQSVGAQEVGWLLKSLGLRNQSAPILSASHVSPSMIVSIFQKLFLIDLQDLRTPCTSVHDEVHNMTILTDALYETIPNLPEMSPQHIVARDPVHISRLLSLFITVHMVQLESSSAQVPDAVSNASSPIDKYDYVQRYVDELMEEMSDLLPTTPIASPREEPVRGGAVHHANGATYAGGPNPHLAAEHAGVPMAATTADAAAGAAAALRQGAPDVARRMQKVVGSMPPAMGASARKLSYAGVHGFSAERAMLAAVRNRQRDTRIEALRSKRFLTQIHDYALSTQLADNQRVAAMQRQLVAERLSREKNYAVELRKLSRQDDVANRTHFMNHLQSLASARRGAIEGSTRRAASASSRVAVADRVRDNFESHVAITAAMTAWRRQNQIAALLMLPR